MTSFQLSIISIALLVSYAATIPGIFLVLRGVALMSDAISHALVPGIVISFLFVQRIDSPLLLWGATVAGMLTVIGIELMLSTRYIKKDTAIGLVFPFFFAVGVLLIHGYARTIHIDTDMVLLGEIAFAPFNRLYRGGVDYGPYALWLLSVIILGNSIMIGIFYKEVKIALFDQQAAQVIGCNPFFIHYMLMFLTTLTIVGAFDIVGSIVVVALIITPAATAFLLTRTLSHMISLSLVIASAATLSGYAWAFLNDISIAGAIATMAGFFFIIVFFFESHNGLFIRWYMQWRMRRRIIKSLGKKGYEKKEKE